MAIALAFLPYGWLLRAPTALNARWLWGSTLAAGALLVAAPSVLSDDLFRYLWDGRVLRAGIDPYAYAPSAPELAFLRDALWNRVNHPDVPTIYPPASQLLFGVAGAVAHHTVTPKILAMTAHLATIGVVRRLVSDRSLGACSRWTSPTHAAAVYGLNPLALSESALGGHVDAIAGLLIALFVSAMLRGRHGRAVAAVVAATAVKLVGILLAPLLWREHRGAAVVALILSACCVVPLLRAGRSGDVPGIGQFARRWEGNAGAYAVIAKGVEEVALATHGVSPTRVEFPRARKLLGSLRGTAWDPMASYQGPKKDLGDPTELEGHVVGALGARALIVLGLFLAAAILSTRRGRSPPILDVARWLLLAALLLSPQLHPWYLLWLLPLEAAAGGVTGLVLSAAVLVAYAPLDGWLGRREWVESAGPLAFEHTSVLLVLMSELVLRRFRRRGSHSPGDVDPRTDPPQASAS